MNTKKKACPLTSDQLSDRINDLVLANGPERVIEALRNWADGYANDPIMPPPPNVRAAALKLRDALNKAENLATRLAILDCKFLD